MFVCVGFDFARLFHFPFAAAQELKDYVTSLGYGSDGSPPLAAGLELVSVNRTANVWSYAIRMNATWITEPGVAFPLALNDSEIHRSQLVYFTTHFNTSKGTPSKWVFNWCAFMLPIPCRPVTI